MHPLRTIVRSGRTLRLEAMPAYLPICAIHSPDSRRQLNVDSGHIGRRDLDLSDAADLLGGLVAMGARQMPGSGPARCRLHTGHFKSPVHTATTDVQRRCDVGHRASAFEEFHGLISFEPR
jgi:hypothetical protein